MNVLALQRGQKLDLKTLQLDGRAFEIGLRLEQGPAADMVCLGLDAGQKLSDERYFVFFNQMSSPCGGLALLAGTPGQHRLRVDPLLLPAGIQRVIIAVAVDGVGDFGGLSRGGLTFGPAGAAHGTCTFTGGDLEKGNGVLLAELYLRQGTWRLFIRAEGFSGGLDWLLRQHGVTPST